MRRDLNETAFDIVKAATGEGEKRLPAGEQAHPEAAKRGRKGGKRGGLARRAKLTAKERSAIARRAAKARWTKTP
jgi:hypothetical protein